MRNTKDSWHITLSKKKKVTQLILSQAIIYVLQILQTQAEETKI